MKKRFVMLLAMIVFLHTVLVSCATPMPDSFINQQENGNTSTDARTEDVTPMPTDPTTELSTEGVTEPDADETRAPMVFEDESLNDLVEDLRAQGYDMERLTLSGAAKNGIEYRYTVTFSDRAFRKGETIEIVVSELVLCGDELDIRESMETGLFEVCMDQYGEVIYSNTNEYRWKEGNTIFFEIPDDLESGAYMLCLFINDWGALVGPIIIF